MVPYGTDESHSEFVSSAAVTVAFGHDLEDLDFPVDVFNQYPLACQLTVQRLLFLRQRSVLTLFVQYFTVGMIRRNALVTTVHLGLNIRAHGTAGSVFVNPKIVNTTIGLLNT